jgi:hypothetical protein
MPSDGSLTNGTPTGGAGYGPAPHASDPVEGDGPKRLAQLDRFAEEVGRRSRRLLLGHDAVRPSPPAPVDETHTGGGDGVRA